MAEQLSITISFPGSPRTLGIGEGGYKVGRSLTRQGFQVNLICTLPKNPEIELLFNTVKYINLDQALKLAGFSPLRWYPDLNLNLKYGFFDLGASHKIGPGDLFYGYTEAAYRSINKAVRHKTVTILHAANSHISLLRQLMTEENKLWNYSATSLNRFSENRVLAEYQQTDYIRTQSSWVYQTLVERGIEEEKIFWLPPAVDLERYRPATLLPETFTVCFVGAFHLRKGVQYLLPAWDKIQAEMPDAKLVMHGGPTSRFIKRLLEPYQGRSDILWPGGGPADQTFKNSSVCVVPSVEDGFCYVVLEALASGLPVIVTENVGAKDLIKDGVNGFIVPIRDSAAIAERLRWLYQNSSKLNEMSRAARSTAEEYSYDAEGQLLANRLKSLIR
jgi:glycosyltransferase involved in cell wall biosynthesis